MCGSILPSCDTPSHSVPLNVVKPRGRVLPEAACYQKPRATRGRVLPEAACHQRPRATRRWMPTGAACHKVAQKCATLYFSHNPLYDVGSSSMECETPITLRSLVTKPSGRLASLPGLVATWRRGECCHRLSVPL